MTAYQDILYDVERGAATITINRPEKMNAFRPQTCSELVDAFMRAGWAGNGTVLEPGAAPETPKTPVMTGALEQTTIGAPGFEPGTSCSQSGKSGRRICLD